MVTEVLETALDNLDKTFGISSITSLFVAILICLAILFTGLFVVLVATRSSPKKIKNCLATCAQGIGYMLGILTIPYGLYLVGQAFCEAVFEVYE